MLVMSSKGILWILLVNPLKGCNFQGESISLGAWVRKQRALWQQASLSQDRMQILSALGFELGSETEITEEWEYRFDYLVECLIQVVRRPAISKTAV